MSPNGQQVLEVRLSVDSSKPVSEANPSEIVINEVGDIRLTVKSTNGEQVYLVSSHQLIACSRFFAKMIGRSSNFAEAVDFRAHITNPANIASGTPFDLTIDIEEKPLSGMTMILRIMHSRPHGLTSNDIKDVNEWYQVASLADYLDCGEVLKDWVDVWMGKPAEDYYNDHCNLDKWIFISEVFQNRKVFEGVTKQAILRIYTIDDSEEVFLNVADTTRDKMEVDIMTATSPAVLSAIMTKRESVGRNLAKLLIAVEQYYNGYPKSGPQYPDDMSMMEYRCPQHQSCCDFLYIGATRYWVDRLKLRAWDEGSIPTNSTIEQFASQLRNLSFPENRDYYGSHYNCNPLRLSQFNLNTKVSEELNRLTGLDVNDFRRPT